MATNRGILFCLLALCAVTVTGFFVHRWMFLYDLGGHGGAFIAEGVVDYEL